MIDMQDFPALLLHGATGIGVWDALDSTAATLLCESPMPAKATSPIPLPGFAHQACGQCPACRLRQAGTHPDLKRLLPEALALELGMGQAADTEEATSAEKRNPSKDISIDAVRSLVDWSHTTSHRGGFKVAVVYPLDAMGAPAANSLLKTLEEPPPSLYFLTGTHRLDRVLPTLRSRCQLQAMPRPQAVDALRALQAREIAQPEQVAHWCHHAVYEPEPASGMDWARSLLQTVTAGQGASAASAAGSTPQMPVAVAALQKLCVDMMRTQFRQQPLYLPADQSVLGRLASIASAPRLLAFWQRLGDYSRTATFPLHANLTAEALILEFKQLFTRSAH
ncbi:DNA polymerase III subunit delta' [Thiomonas sp.]